MNKKTSCTKSVRLKNSSVSKYNRYVSQDFNIKRRKNRFEVFVLLGANRQETATIEKSRLKTVTITYPIF